MYQFSTLRKMTGFLLLIMFFCLGIPGILFAGGASEQDKATQKALVEKVDKVEMKVNELAAGAGAEKPSCLKCHSSSEPGFPLLGARVGYDTSGHKNLGNSYYANGGGCQQCHTNEGFIEYVKNGKVDASAYVNYPSQIGCFTCHQPHETFDLSLRTTKPVTLVGGQTFDLGSGNLCANCHQARGDGKGLVKETAANAVRSSWGSHHGPQANILLGAGAYEYPGKSYSSSMHGQVITDSCVACHMGLPEGRYALAPAIGGHSFNIEGEVHESAVVNVSGCLACHKDIKKAADAPVFAVNAKDDYDQDGKVEPVQQEVKGLLDKFVNAKGNGYLQTLPLPLYLADGAWNATTATTVRSVKEMAALFNYKFFLEDRSNGIHNTTYTVQVLYDTLASLDPAFNVSKRPK